MAEYVTREDIVSVGATTLTDLYDDGDPGTILAPTSHIKRIIYTGIARLDAEASTLVAGVRLRGDAMLGQPVIALGAYGLGGAGTGTSATVSLGPTVLNVDIPCIAGKTVLIVGLVAGTAGDDVNMSVTLEFD